MDAPCEICHEHAELIDGLCDECEDEHGLAREPIDELTRAEMEWERMTGR